MPPGSAGDTLDAAGIIRGLREKIGSPDDLRRYLFHAEPISVYGPIRQRISRLTAELKRPELVERIDGIQHRANRCASRFLQLMLNSGEQRLRPPFKEDHPALTRHKLP